MSRPHFAGRKWTRSEVIAVIRAEAAAGQELSYTRTERRVPSLLRAAERVFGTWAAAVEAAGFNYDDIRRYRRWTPERVVERIREWHRKGADLSWHHVSTELDPPLAAAARQAGRFASWADALAAAGLNAEEIVRYRRWNLPAVHEELEQLAQQGIALDRKTLSREAAPLLAAVYRVGDGLVVEREKAVQRLTELVGGAADDWADEGFASFPVHANQNFSLHSR